MSRAREILRAYLQRKASDREAAASGVVQEENLRRLLQNTARRPPEHLEAYLLRAMPRAAARRHAPRRLFRWSWPGAGLAPAWALGAALAATGVLIGWHLRSAPPSTSLARVTKGPGGNSYHQGQPPPPPAPTLIGYVLLPQGELLRQRAGQESGTPVEGGTALYLGDTLETEADATGSVVFLDGSICRLAASTTLKYGGPPRPGMKRPSELRLASGETWNQVEKGGPPFAVAGPAATAVVHGTVFGVHVSENGTTSVRVTAGRVEVRNSAGSVLVSAGMQTAARVGQPPLAPTLVPRLVPRHPGRPAGRAKGLPTIESHQPVRRGPEKPASLDKATERRVPPKPSTGEETTQTPHGPMQSSGMPAADPAPVPFTTSH
jgi:hypothetical protein